MNLFKTCAAILLLAPIFHAAAQQDFSNVEIKTIHVAKNVYMLQGSGGNIGVSVGEDGTLIVDDQFAPLAGKILAALKQLNPNKPRYILNTHHHGDHTGGNPQFGRDGEIIAHANVRKRLLASKLEKAGLPVVTFEDSLSVHFNGDEVKIIHVPPAHTDGDSVVYFMGANVIHFGDTFFSGRFPNIDLNGGGSVRGFIKGIGDAIPKIPADAKLIPGHGPLSTIKQLKEFHEMLIETSAIVQKAIDAGKTLDEVKAAGLPQKFKSWEAPTLKTDRWLEILYNGLKAK
jgi:cyclase